LALIVVFYGICFIDKLLIFDYNIQTALPWHWTHDLT